MFRCIAFGLTISFILLPISKGLPAGEFQLSQHLVTTNAVDTTTEQQLTESLAMLMQVINRLEFFVKTKDLSSIHNEDLILSMALTGLFAGSHGDISNETNRFKADLTDLGLAVSALHTVADDMKQAESETALQNVLEKFSNVKRLFPKATWTSAQARALRFMCPMHPEETGKHTDLCPKCGMELDQLIRIQPFSSRLPATTRETITASVTTTEPIRLFRMNTAHLHLQRATGKPVLLSELIEAHTEKIHLLIIDPSLTDYHHEHPRPTENPGEYVFRFSPRKPGSYRVWADLQPYPLGLQEYVTTDISAPTTPEPFTNRSINFKATVDSLNYELILSQKIIKAGKPVSAKLRVTMLDGKGFVQLEPLMAAFAHIVGFNEDFRTVLHMHPKGAPITDPAARGGPELEFQIYALQPGFYRVFAQVQIDGRSHFALFGIRVEP